METPVFPPEIIQCIVTAIVEEIGLPASVRLRGVNKTFNRAVFHAYETLYLFRDSVSYNCSSFLPTHNLTYSQPIIPFLAAFLCTRPHMHESSFRKLYADYHRKNRGCEPAMPKEKERLNIAFWLHYILDQLHYPAGEGAERYEALQVLMRQIDDIEAFEHNHGEGVPGVVRMVLEEGFIPFRKPFDAPGRQDHLLSAAILLNLEGVYMEMLESYTPPKGYERYDCWNYLGSPLYAAVKAGNQELVRRFLGEGQRRGEGEGEMMGFRPLEGAVKMGDREMMEIILADEKFLPVVADSGNVNGSADADLSAQMENLTLPSDPPSPPPKIQAVEDIKRALIRCSRLGYTALAQRLVDYVSQHAELLPGILGNKKFLAEMMYHACLCGYIDFMDFLLENGGDINTFYGEEKPTPKELVAWRGNMDVLRWVIEHDEKKGAWGIEGVLAAMLSRDVEVLKCVLECNGTREAGGVEEWMALCWYGIRMHLYDVVSFLLEDLKVIDSVAEFRKQPEQFGALMEVCASEGHPQAFDMLCRLGWPFDEPLCQGGNGINEDWTPMMFCQASLNEGAIVVREKLKELGVKEVDMLGTKAKDLFETGYYPHGSTAIESQMPNVNSFREKRVAYLKARDIFIEIKCK